MDYIENGAQSFDFALLCAEDIRKFVYLDVPIQKLKEYVCNGDD